MMTWLLGNFLGLARWAWLGIAVAALTGAFLWLQAREEADDKANQEIGAQKAVNAGQETTLDQVGNANDAGNEVRNDRNGAKYAECLRSAAEGFESGCERYKPIEPVSD